MAVVGGMDVSAQELLDLGITAIVPTVPDICTMDNAMKHAERNYQLAAQRMFSLLKLGRLMNGAS